MLLVFTTVLGAQQYEQLINSAFRGSWRDLTEFGNFIKSFKNSEGDEREMLEQTEKIINNKDRNTWNISKYQ